VSVARVVHESFTVSRRFDASPSDVFGLFADETTWRRWFRMPGSAATYTHDFRVGGSDHATSEFRMPDGRIERLENSATYDDLAHLRGAIQLRFTAMKLALEAAAPTSA
jgi:uncharacterized protein YndB with AHSA1/START domain